MWPINNFLDNEKCESLITFHKENFEKLLNNLSNYHDKTEVIQFSLLHNIDLSKQIAADITCHVRQINTKAFINYFQIVKWPNGSYQDEHLDFPEHVLTSIIYLNDDYEGGETVVGDKIIKPEKGKIITFQGNEIKHKVNQITKSTTLQKT
jgi:hypothetical protein